LDQYSTEIGCIDINAFFNEIQLHRFFTAGFGTKRRFIVMRRTLAVGAIADVNGRGALANSIESDP